MGDNNKGSGFLKGFIIGCIVGLVISFFLSRKGGKSKLNTFFAQGRDSIQEAIDEGKAAAAREEASLRENSVKESQ
jgi:gas vesicle protein